VTATQAEHVVRRAVTAARPVLLPHGLPDSWRAVVEASSSDFTVTYHDDRTGAELLLALAVPNPPPPGPRGTQGQPRFHGDRHSPYQVADATDPRSHRLLMWIEPGSWAVTPSLAGVPYLLSATGLTDPEFLTIAASLSAHAGG
jgi:hypothetical protein